MKQFKFPAVNCAAQNMAPVYQVPQSKKPRNPEKPAVVAE